MSIQPKSILDNLITQLSAYLRDNEKPDDFTLLRFKAEAEKLKVVSRAESAMAKGIIAGLERNLQECKKQHDLSLTLNDDLDNDHVFYQNYALSLNRLGQNKDAYHFIKMVVDIHPHVPIVICLCIDIAFYAGYPENALKYYDDLIKLDISNIPSTVEKCIYEAKIMTSMGFEDEIISKFSQIVEEIYSKNNVSPMNSSLHKVDDELFQWIETTADVDTTVDMNFELAEKISERDDLILSGFNVVFRAHQ